MSDRTFEDGWRAACESLAATYTDVARDSIALERRENFSNAAAAARFRANEPDTPAPSDAARTQAIEHAARRVLSVFEVARSPWSGAPSRAIEPSGATEALDALLVAVESPAPPPPPMETAAVEELASALVDSITYYEERNDANPKRARSLWNDVQQRCIALSAALTRLRATTTGTKEDDNGNV